MKKSALFVREWVLPVVFTVIITLLFRTHIAEARFIPTASMEPTIQTYDLVLIDKIHHKDIQRGDIVTFYTPYLYDGKTPLIKRVIALPGETLQIENGQVYIDGQALRENYLKNHIMSDYGPLVIGDHAYFLMGDNRGDSCDSRYLGTIDAAQIRGKFIRRIPVSSVFHFLLDKLQRF